MESREVSKRRGQAAPDTQSEKVNEKVVEFMTFQLHQADQAPTYEGKLLNVVPMGPWVPQGP